MSETLIGVGGIIALFFCLVARMPVGMALLLVGFGGIWVIDGQRAAIATMSSETYSSITAYSLSIIPLFVLMGNMAGAAAYSQRLYEAAYAWIGRLRGGLASATVLGCAAFAAVSGSSVATAVTIGKVALPQMKRFGYADGLATRVRCGRRHLGHPDPAFDRFRPLRDPYRAKHWQALHSRNPAWHHLVPVLCPGDLCHHGHEAIGGSGRPGLDHRAEALVVRAFAPSRRSHPDFDWRNLSRGFHIR